MRPVEQKLSALRGERDLLLTERRRRDRNAHRESRADLKAAMREGKFPTVAELVAGSQAGSLDDYAFNLKTGGEVRLGYPGARAQSLSLALGRGSTPAGRRSGSGCGASPSCAASVSSWWWCWSSALQWTRTHNPSSTACRPSRVSTATRSPVTRGSPTALV